MTNKAAYFSALKGDTPSRTPLWLVGFPPAFSPDKDDFTRGWMADPEYRELYHELFPHLAFSVKMPLHEGINRVLCVPGHYIKAEPRIQKSENERILPGRILAPGGDLYFENVERRGLNTSWHTRPPVSSVKELVQVFDIPFSADEGVYAKWYSRYLSYNELADGSVVVMIDLPSPIVAISNLMTLELFLELSLTEQKLFHEILGEITRRILLLLSEFLNRYTLDCAANLGGSEQCTPPLMPPERFDEYVVPYDGELVKLLSRYNIPVNMHCHGRVKHALSRMTGMGISSTDPVEPPPSGDVTFEQALKIADNKLTLVGNLEFDELEFSSKEHITNRVKEILSFKGQRIILGASDGPVSRISSKLVENYRALLEAYVKYA